MYGGPLHRGISLHAIVHPYEAIASSEHASGKRFQNRTSTETKSSKEEGGGGGSKGW